MDVIADRYELGRTLGAGGMARVVEAHDRVLDRRVAMKLLRDDISIDPSIRDRFLQEARTAVRFNHPNAVVVFDAGQDGRTPWIAMELVEGQDLAQRLAGGPLDEVEAVTIAAAVLAALAAAHADGMVHRDVKPGNIMLPDSGGVKLADFGIAKSMQDASSNLTATGQIFGTAKYLSPEQVDGRPATQASDVYATGVVLFEMLTGGPPFTGDNPMAVALAHTRDEVPDLRARRPEVSAGVAAVVRRAMAKDPGQRYRDAGEMRRALQGEAVPSATIALGAADVPTTPLSTAGATVPLTAASSTEVLPPAGTAVRRRPQRRIPIWIIALTLVTLLGALFLFNLEPTEKPTAQERRNRDQEPANPPVTEPADPTEQREPASEPPPETPTDIASLIDVLAGHPGEYGEKQEQLLNDLRTVFTASDDQGEVAAKLIDEIEGWVGKGELDSEIGSLAIGFLEPLVLPIEEDDEDDDEGTTEEKPGKGKGIGKDKGKDE